MCDCLYVILGIDKDNMVLWYALWYFMVLYCFSLQTTALAHQAVIFVIDLEDEAKSIDKRFRLNAGTRQSRKDRRNELIQSKMLGGWVSLMRKDGFPCYKHGALRTPRGGNKPYCSWTAVVMLATTENAKNACWFFFLLHIYVPQLMFVWLIIIWLYE